MARTKKSTERANLDPKIGVLDIAARKLISTIDTSYNEKILLSERDAKIQNIINGELDLAKGISKGSIIDFVTTMAKDSAKNQGIDPNQVDGYALFNEDVGNLFSYFQEMYKNRYVELADLKLITKFIPAIGEAVKVTLDAIVSSDDYSETISRNLEFGPTLTIEEKAAVQAEIERIERDEKLLKKLKNIVYNKTLVSGNHYVYHIPYAELFSEYDRLVKEGKIVDKALVNNAIANNNQSKAAHDAGFNITKRAKGFAANESYAPGLEGFSPENAQIVDYAIESLGEDYNDSDKKVIRSQLIESFNNVTVVDSHVIAEALEGYSSVDMMRENLSSYRDTFSGLGVLEENPDQVTDGTFSTTASPEKFNVLGSYIKYIDASKLVPIKVYNQVIGYLHVHDMTASKKASSINAGTQMQMSVFGNTGMFNTASMTEEKRNRAVQTIVNSVTDGILTNFSNKFVNKNADFKKLIGDCIVANGFVNTAFQIQFIPAKYITAFSINENEDGVGQSMLQDSLFPAKLLLSLIVSKLLLYMNKTGNKTIAYVRKGPIDVSTSNHVQRTIRMLQEADITFSDLLSTNLSFQKFNRNGNIQLPMAKNGDRLIDFETQEGQNVDLSTEMEQFLEKLAILGTGVPSVIMEYTDAADYAKSLVTANLKFAGRTATLQSDLEDSTTDVYKALIATSNLPDDIKRKVIPTFKFKLCRPRVLTNSNMADYLSQMESVTTSLARIFLGDNDADEEATEIRRRFIQEIGIQLLPFISWDEFKEILEKIKVEAASQKDLDKSSNSSNDLGGSSSDDEFL